MDEIFKSRPHVQLENAGRQVKSYVLLLEKKLIENKRLDTENQQLKQYIVLLRKEIQELKINDKGIKAQETGAKTKVVEKQRNISDNDPDANSVLIKGFTESQLNTIPRINVMDLGRVMGIKVQGDDIIKVTKLVPKYYETRRLKPSNITIIVQFRTPDLKIEYLKNKEKLKLQPGLNDVDINDYVSEETFHLYQYAKVLKASGYALVYWRNNRVYVKKTRSNLCEPILIESTNDVDALKLENKT